MGGVTVSGRQLGWYLGTQLASLQALLTRGHSKYPLPGTNKTFPNAMRLMAD